MKEKQNIEIFLGHITVLTCSEPECKKRFYVDQYTHACQN